MFCLLYLVACSGPTGNPEDGKRWYVRNNCSSCHGEEGRNGEAPELAGLKMRYSSFIKKLRKSGSVSMPDFPEEQISQQDAADIYSWLKSIR